jgi:hypothetical protein
MKAGNEERPPPSLVFAQSVPESQSDSEVIREKQKLTL